MAAVSLLHAQNLSNYLTSSCFNSSQLANELLRYRISIVRLLRFVSRHVSSAGKLISKLCPFRLSAESFSIAARVKLQLYKQRLKLTLVSRKIICSTTFTGGSSITFTFCFHLNRDFDCDKRVWFYCRVLFRFVSLGKSKALKHFTMWEKVGKPFLQLQLAWLFFFLQLPSCFHFNEISDWFSALFGRYLFSSDD